jgi:hypothetical protein
LDTIVNSVMWVDKTKDPDEVMLGKLSSFQREVYLHLDQDHLVDQLEKLCISKGVPFTRLSNEYLEYVFTYERDTLYEMYKDDHNKKY